MCGCDRLSEDIVYRPEGEAEMIDIAPEVGELITDAWKGYPIFIPFSQSSTQC